MMFEQYDAHFRKAKCRDHKKLRGGQKIDVVGIAKENQQLSWVLRGSTP